MKHSIKKTSGLVFAALILFASNLHAWEKHQQVSGQILDERTKSPVAQAKITFLKNKKGQFEAISDDQGKYNMPAKLLTHNGKPYEYEVTVEALHYKELKTKVSVPYQKKSTVTRDFNLNRDIQSVQLTIHVNDGSSHTGLAGVSVSLKSSQGFGEFKGVSNSLGNLTFPALSTDPDPKQAHTYTLDVKAAHYIPVQQKFIAKVGLPHQLRFNLKRELKKQVISGKVLDKNTGKGLAKAKLVFKYPNAGIKHELTSGATGEYMIKEGLLTDTKDSRAFVYQVSVSAENYLPITLKVKVAYAERKASLFNFTMLKKPLKAPSIKAPLAQTLSRTPEIVVSIPAEIQNRLSKALLQIASDASFKKILYREELLFNHSGKVKTLKHRVSKEKKLDDDQRYYLRVKLFTHDFFESEWAEGAFSIPSSESINPPFPEHVVTRDEYTNIHPAWCDVSGQDQILFASNRGDDSSVLQIWRARVGAAGFTQVTTAIQGSRDNYPTAGPGGKYITFISNRIANISNMWSVPKSGARLLTQRTPYQKGTVRYPSMNNNGSVIAFARNSKKIKKGSPIRSSIWTMSQNGSDLTQLCRGTMPKISPHGKYILFINDSLGNRDIWRIGVKGTGLTQITSTPEDENNPDWVNENKIIFASLKSGNSDIWMLDLESGLQQQLTNNLADEGQPSCNMNGSKVAFISDRSGSNNIYYIDLSSALESESGSRLQKR